MLQEVTRRWTPSFSQDPDHLVCSSLERSIKYQWPRENAFKFSWRSSTWWIKWEDCRVNVVHRLWSIVASECTSRTSRSDENLFRHDKTLSIKRRETRTKERDSLYLEDLFRWCFSVWCISPSNKCPPWSVMWSASLPVWLTTWSLIRTLCQITGVRLCLSLFVIEDFPSWL